MEGEDEGKDGGIWTLEAALAFILSWPSLCPQSLPTPILSGPPSRRLSLSAPQ